MRRHRWTLVVAAGLLAACGGSKETASSGEAVAEAPAESAVADSGAAQAALDEIVAAIQAYPEVEFTCTPESFVMTSAVRSVCGGFTSVAVSAYAWTDAATMGGEIEREVYCTTDSGLDGLTSVRGDNWAISLAVFGGGDAEDQATIAEMAAGLSTATGGAVQTDPCR